jgi:MFS family permease
VAIAGMQLMATMDGTIAIVTLPRISEELRLSDAGRSWVITAYVLAFGGLMLLGGRLGDTIGRKRTFVAGVALLLLVAPWPKSPGGWRFW